MCAIGSVFYPARTLQSYAIFLVEYLTSAATFVCGLFVKLKYYDEDTMCFQLGNAPCNSVDKSCDLYLIHSFRVRLKRLVIMNTNEIVYNNLPKRTGLTV